MADYMNEMVQVPRRLLFLAAALLSDRMPCAAPQCEVADDVRVQRCHDELCNAARGVDVPSSASPDYSDEPWQDKLLERAVAAGFKRDSWGDWIAAEDVRRLTRELDELLNGTNAAKQASLCDIVAQVRREGIRSCPYGVAPTQGPSKANVELLAMDSYVVAQQGPQPGIGTLTPDVGVEACETERDCTQEPWCRINSRCHRQADAQDRVADARSEAERVCHEAYQVVGSLLSDLGKFDTPEAEKILDNLSRAKLVHKDVLPWIGCRGWQRDTFQPAGDLTSHGRWIPVAELEHDRPLCEGCTTPHDCHNRMNIPRPCGVAPSQGGQA